MRSPSATINEGVRIAWFSIVLIFAIGLYSCYVTHCEKRALAHFDRVMGIEASR